MPKLFRSLSARLLVLTAFFALVAEILIYTPSIARFRQTYLEERLAAAHLAALAIEAAPDFMVTKPLEAKLLTHVGAWSIELEQPGMKVHMLSAPMPPSVDARFDLNHAGWMGAGWMGQVSGALEALTVTGNRVIEVAGPSPKDPAAQVVVVMDEAPMIAAMLAYSGRMLEVSVAISLLTAGAVFLSLDRLLVRPMRRIVGVMMAFRADPEGSPTVTLSRRRDEVGIAERELVDLQATVRAALRQQARLAALGQAVARVNHDLRGILANAALISERLAGSDDPEVQRAAPRLLDTLDRAVELCSRTLGYTRDNLPEPRRQPVALAALADAVAASLADPAVLVSRVPADLRVLGDDDQLFRVLANLVQNAVQAGADRILVDGRAISDPAGGRRVLLTVADNGPGLPPRARANLFQPFAGSARPGGTGLGLAIAREIARAHGGDLRLAETGPAGSRFDLELPD